MSQCETCGWVDGHPPWCAANRSLAERVAKLEAKDADADWHRVGDGAFARPFGTVRQCIDCGALVGGGPTRCSRCANAAPLASGQLASAGEAPHICECSNAPCPACGGHGPSGEWSEGYEVTCDDCGVTLMVASCEPCKGRSTFEVVADQSMVDEPPAEQATGCGAPMPPWKCGELMPVGSIAVCGPCHQALDDPPHAPAAGTLSERLTRALSPLVPVSNDDIRGWRDSAAALEVRLAQAEGRQRELLEAVSVVTSERDHARTQFAQAEERVKRQTDWYQQRFNRLRKWVDEEVRPLSADVATRYFSICANGSPAPHESADWTDTMHALRLKLAQAERERTEYRDDLNAEMDGALELRKLYGARENETWRDFLARMVAERDEARDCGQAGVCIVAPGCQRHWSERAMELSKERERCASACEAMVVGGRAWSHDQQIAAEALLAAAKFIRSGKPAPGTDKP